MSALRMASRRRSFRCTRARHGPQTLAMMSLPHLTIGWRASAGRLSSSARRSRPTPAARSTSSSHSSRPGVVCTTQPRLMLLDVRTGRRRWTSGRSAPRQLVVVVHILMLDGGGRPPPNRTTLGWNAAAAVFAYGFGLLSSELSYAWVGQDQLIGERALESVPACGC